MKNYQLVIFDLDGTLLDTTKGILASVKHAIEQLGLPQLSDKELLTFIGPPIQESFSKCYNLPEDLLKKATGLFRDTYSNENLFQAEPYQGIYEVMNYLSANQIKSAMATYKREDYALKLLKYFKFDEYTDVMFGADNENKLTKSDIIMKCLNKSGIEDPSQVVVIGDTLYDAIGAKNMNVDFIAVTYGFGFGKNEDLSEIDFVARVDEPLEIINFLSA
jgi:phosphoglycolate phosphatase